LWLGLAPSAYAQAEPLAVGREVRLFVRGVIAPLEGRLLSISRDELTISMADGAVFAISPEQLQRTQVLGTRRNTARGLFLGAALGFGAGIAWIVRSDCPRDASGFCEVGDSFNEWALVVPPVLGAGAGALAGYLIRTPRWAPGLLPQQSAAGGLAARLTWAVPIGS
jgi:hypothetical protein